MSDHRNVVVWCENTLTVSTIVTPHGNAKCMNDEVALGASLARAAVAEWQSETRRTA